MKAVCPDCGASTEVDDRAWSYICPECGEHVHLLADWWNDNHDKSFRSLTDVEKREAFPKFYESKHKWEETVIQL